MEKLSEGAESIIEIVNDKILQKTRLEKKYRHPQLDVKLRKFRCKREFKILLKLQELKINVPKPYEISKNKTDFTFEFLKGEILKNCLNEELLKKAFNQIIKMHKAGIIHGDLTTLNMINKNKEIYLIDFGLSKFSSNIEEKGVDLNLFFNCIKNEHNEFYSLKDKLIQKYSKEIDNEKEVIKRLEEIEMRGRNKNKKN